MLEHLKETLHRKPLIGVVFSVAIHAALLLLLVGVHPARTPVQKRGDALIVELPNPEESAMRGTPGPQADAPLVPAPAPKPQPAPSARSPRPTPPSPARPPAVARPAPKPEPREAPRAVARAPQPPPAEQGEMPAAKPTPEPAAEAPKTASAAPAPEPPKPDAPAPPAVASAPPSPPGPVAMAPPPPDIRAAFRRGGGGGGTGVGGAGGSGTGRAGIEGEPVALDSKDPNFNDYLERVRALIKKHWNYPCVKNADTRECEYKSGQLVIEFGILRNGQLGFVELHRSSGYAIMDDYAANAIKLASPFPAIPAGLLQNRKGTGLPILARFNYVVETGLTNVLR